MFEYLWLPCMVTVAAIALSSILFKEFLRKKRAGQIAVEGRADSDSTPKNGTVESAAPTSTSPPVMETATSSGHDYEVFLSFRGPDTRAGFTDFLYTSLVDAGIRAFKDDEDLRVGEEFASELLQAINQSKISIPIFSKGYASSVWCLKELVQMVECNKSGGQKIMPIFYDVAPSEVRYQTEGYGKSLISHEKKKRCDKKTISEWKAALKEVSFLNGWDLHSMPNRREGEFARKLTQKVFNELKKAYLVVSDCLVNVDNHVDVIMEMTGAGTNETRIIGIHGMGGIGKTTIAKIIYNRLSEDFENHCFLRDIRERSKANGMQCLQNQLISDILKMRCMDIRDIDEGTQTIKDRLSSKRVLLLLDDVEEESHIDALVGKRDWLGRGSKIIITTRFKDILDVPEVDCSYELSGMDADQSLQLFSKHAFRRDSPLEDYIDQSNRAIGIAGGLPLALEVIGSLLCRTKKDKWDLTLKKLENVPHAAVQSKLKISYDVLDVRQRHIFLDIACLFIGYDKDIVVHFWDDSKFPEEAMEVLQNMSLIKIRNDKEVWMHDQLRDLGREIVRQESNMEIKKQSRVWDPQEALDLLRRYEGKKEVEALYLHLGREGQFHFTYEGLMGLSKLRFLGIGGQMEYFRAEERLLWHESPSNGISTNVFHENLYLLPQLRWLSWNGIPTTFNITNFSMDDVIILDLSGSELTHHWKGWSHMKAMKSLKILNLSNCECLERTPIFSAQANLERLILYGCVSLMKIDESICQLKRLVSLDLGYCRNLQRLPGELGGALARLEYLSLHGCESLERLPDTIGSLESLIELDISWTGIKELPDSIGELKNLKVVKVLECDIKKISNVFWTIGKLEEIEICDTLRDLINIERTKGFVKIGNCIHLNQSLRILKLECGDIYALPNLPESLIKLRLYRLCMDRFPDISNLTNLKELELLFCSLDSNGKSYGPLEDPIPLWIGNFSKLDSLDLCFECETTSPTDLSLPPQLKSLHLRGSNLSRLPTLPSSLSSLDVEDCSSLCSMEDLSNLKKLSSLRISYAAITEIQGLGCLENLRNLQLGFLEVEILPDLSNLKKLRNLEISDCDNLVEIQGDYPKSLKVLEISSCKSLRKCPIGPAWTDGLT